MTETRSFEICFGDLTQEAQKRFCEFVGEDEVNDFIPLAIIEIEAEEEAKGE